jgi:uncharacterized SAM-binding protein YcdF (DUF218 family)
VIPNVLKELLVPGTLAFLFAALTCGTFLLYRKKDNGRAGRRLISIVLALYWIWSTPVLAVPLLNLLTPAYPPVESRTQAAGANAIVVLGAGLSVFRSRGDMLEISTREDALRVMEGARVYRVLDQPWVIVTGGLGSTRQTEAAHMAAELQSLGVPADRIVIEGQARNTHEHGLYVTTLLHERQTKRFVLVTSRQHIARALGVFRKAGWDPIPSSPDAYFDDGHTIEWVLPSRDTLRASEQLIYDKCAMVYYRLRGWV